MYSGDVPAILSARKTYSFRGIELTLSRLSLSLAARQTSHHRQPHVRSRSLIRLRDNPPTTTQASLFLSVPAQHMEYFHSSGDLAFYGTSLSEEICLAYTKSDENARFLCDPINLRLPNKIEVHVKISRSLNIIFEIFVHNNAVLPNSYHNIKSLNKLKPYLLK